MKLLEFFTGFITVFNNPLYELLFGGLLLSISGSIAYAIGRCLEYRGKSGFILWLVTAVAVYATIACIIRFVMWLVTIPWWIWLIVGAVVIAIAVAAVAIVKKEKQHDRRD